MIFRRIPLRICLALLIYLACAAGFADNIEAAPFSARQKRNAEPQPLTPETFKGRLLVSGQADELLSFELTEAVYSRLVRKDFRDICVFDSNGTPVPFTLRAPDSSNAEGTQLEEEIPFFPWAVLSDRLVESKPGNTRGMPLRPDVEIDTAGGIVRIRTRQENTLSADASSQHAAPAPPDSLLLDMSAFQDKHRMPHGFTGAEQRAFSLTIQPRDEEGFITNAVVRSSNSLENWNQVSDQTLARLMKGGSRIERLSIELPVPCPRYLLLTFSGDVPAIRSISGEARYSRKVAQLRHTHVPGLLGPDKRSVAYTVSGAYPLAGVNFILPRPDIVPVRLEAKMERADTWHFLVGGAIYRLEEGGAAMHSPMFSLAFPRGMAPDWRLAASGDIPFSDAPALQLNWKPHSLLFLARGKGPWTVAFGREFPVAGSPFPTEATDLSRPAEVLAGTVGGASAKAIQADMGRNEHRERILLFAALGTAVLFLSGIALFLMRSMAAANVE